MWFCMIVLGQEGGQWPVECATEVCSFFVCLFVCFLAALGLRCCTWAFFSCGEWGLLFVVVHRLLIVVASLVAEHGL